MSILQFLIIIFSVLFILFGIDLYKRKKMNILHFIIFFFGGGLLLLFTINVNLLNKFGNIFGVARGADLIVYISIIILAYLYIIVINSQTKNSQQLTKFISYDAINKTINNYINQIKERKNTTENDNFLFHIRVYNESKKLEETINSIIKKGYKKFIFINDGSQDNSLEILKKLKKNNPNCLIIILSHTINRGGGAANQTGFNFIRKYGNILKSKWIITYDSDGQMSVEDMEKFKNKIKEYPQIKLFLGSRFINGASATNITKSRRIILNISKIVTKLFYGTNISDPHCGYRVFHVSLFKYFKLTSDGMHYANEINEIINKKKIKYKEIPVNINYSKYSLSKGQKNSNSLKLGIEMIYKKLFFR